MKTVLVLSFTDLARDPRPHRQIRALTGEYRVVAAGLGHPADENVDFIPLAWHNGNGRTSVVERLTGARRRLLRVGRLAAGPVLPHDLRERAYERVYWESPIVADALGKLARLRPDAVVANDLETLPVALRIAAGAPVIFDAHEYAPREFEDRFLFRVLQQPYRANLVARYVPRAAAMTTVCDAIASAYAADVGDVRSEIITNAAAYAELTPSPVDDRVVRMIHHGIASPSRRIENMIRLMDHLDDRFRLDLMLMTPSPRYAGRLRRMAADDPRIRFRAPVSMLEIPRATNEYDIGLFLLEPTNFNYRHALPNKLFEFVQARLAVAIGPSPEMARVVREWELGIVADDYNPRTLARQLRTVSPDQLRAFKARSNAAARNLCAERNGERLRALIARAIGAPNRAERPKRLLA